VLTNDNPAIQMSQLAPDRASLVNFAITAAAEGWPVGVGGGGGGPDVLIGTP
jgi:hypothetical protein